MKQFEFVFFVALGLGLAYVLYTMQSTVAIELIP